jgi:8-hydroxy-5-deazaflavin:NADPH oxidoreductase
MTVTIIGAGNMGRGIGTRAVAGGNDVEVIDRDPEEARKLAEELQAAASNGGTARALEPGGVIGGEVVVLAVYYPSIGDIVDQYQDQLAGKVVVDIANPVDVETFDRLVTPPDGSSAQETAQLLPEARVVKAFNTTFATTLAGGEVAGQQLDVLVAGDDDEAKGKVAELVKAGGLRAVDAGPLQRARELEALGFLHMKVQDSLGSGYASTVKFLS